MKKQSVLALLLGLTLLCTAVIPSVFAADGDSSDNGMVISKTAKANTDGTYTIQLEAYATGSKIISEVTEDVPTDIVLVLDQSGSMANNFSTVTVESYPESSGTNATFYANQDDLYYQLDDGGYVKVTVTREEIGVTYQYNEVPYYYKINSKLKEYADNNNLYYQVDGNYRPVTVEVIDNWPTSYTYKYTDENGSHEIESVNSLRRPRYTYYTKETVTVYKYTYSYTVGGETIEIESSEGNTNTPAEKFYRKTTTTQNLTCLDALKNAVTTFADNVAQKAAGADGILGTKDDVNHRIAIAGFSSGYNNTELLTGVEITTGEYRGSSPSTSDSYYYFPTGYEKNGANYYSGITAEQYGKALQNMNESDGQQNVSNGIAAITAEGGTMINQGLDMANEIFKNNPLQEGDKRNRVIVVFTDGAPGKYGNWQQASRDTANSALSNADISKNTYNATVYTVGVFSGADASNPSNLPSYTTNNNPSTAEQTNNSNRFMHLLSSNYPKASSMSSTGSIDPNLDGKSYYLSAADADTLKNIFQQISDQIESGGSSTTLSSETVIKDIIAPAFTLPEDADNRDITLETYKCTGKSGDAYTWSNNNSTMDAVATVSGDQVSVTGFDFADNYVGTVTSGSGTTYRGNKLVISFTVKPKSGFLGGNNVYTNTNAGVYENSSATNPVMTFPQPQVNVPIGDVTVGAADKNVYLLGGVTAAQLKEGATVTVGGVSLDLTADNFGLETWQTEYVGISVKYYDADGETEITDLSNLTDDTTYTVEVTVTPKSNGKGASGTPATAKSGNNAGNVNVFKPELTFKDSEVYYGDTVTQTELESNLTGTKWLHNGTEADTTTMGTAPALTLEYSPNSGTINTKQDVPVDVTVKIDAADVTVKTTFAHNNCEGKTCTVPNGYEFLLHVKTCQLTVTKSGGVDGEPYVFTVYKDGEAYTEVTVVGNGSETICELPVGTYTIEEDTGWSWRFNPDYSNGVTLSKANTAGTITCTNSTSSTKWLNGFSAVVTNIFGVKH